MTYDFSRPPKYEDFDIVKHPSDFPAGSGAAAWLADAKRNHDQTYAIYVPLKYDLLVGRFGYYIPINGDMTLSDVLSVGNAMEQAFKLGNPDLLDWVWGGESHKVASIPEEAYPGFREAGARYLALAGSIFYGMDRHKPEDLGPRVAVTGQPEILGL